MIFDTKGLPKVTGASDLQDSSALAGIMTVFEWPQYIDMMSYLLFGNTVFYTRHPDELKYDFSRDQAICLVAGLSKQEPSMVQERFITGKDWLPPSVMGHIRRCQGRKSSLFQDLWLWLDVAFHAKVTPTDEPNQLLCMMLCADVKYLKAWCRWNSQWERSINRYWFAEDGAWRKEPELAAHMISKIKTLIFNSENNGGF
jgi:hypothetical protein